METPTGEKDISSAPSTVDPNENLSISLPDLEKAITALLPTPEQAPEPEEARSVHGLKWVLVCCGIYFSAFLYGLDNTIAADIQDAVIDTYGDISKLTWLGSGFPLGSIATILTL